MRKSLLLMLILTAFLVSLTVRNLSASSKPLVSVDPKISMASAGTTLVINVTVTNVTATQALYSYDINLTFNPAILNLTGVEEGSFLKQAGSTWWMDPQNGTGWVLFGNSLIWFMPPPPPGASGNGTLATVTFDVLAEGRSDLNFSMTALNTIVEEDGVWISDPIDHDSENGVFTIFGDVTGDGLVDICDLARIGKAYGSTPGTPKWDKTCDMTGPAGVPDDVIDNYDLALCGKNYGKSVP